MAINNRILIVDDELSVRRLLFEVARRAGYEAFLAENGQEAIEQTKEIKPAVIIMDIKMPVMDGLEAFERIRADYPDVAVILMTAHGTVDTAVEAMKRGAFDYLVKPSNVTEVRIVLERAFQMRRLREEVAALRHEVQNKYQLGNIIGKSAVMQQVYKTVGRVAPTNATVLITGESGSGKELIAKTIHNNSPRRDGPFIKVNCGALPEGLMESELFGYEKGAFTGAVGRKPGRFELAHQGTLFLDEVGELTPPLQVKLLRVLQEREFERVGGTETIKVDVRIIAATNRNLEEMVHKGLFREDLYYRLKVVPIHVPPLRERVEDIPLFVDYFVRRFAAEAHREVPYVTPEAMELFKRYHWPGNVRELANVLERAVIMSSGVIGVQDLPGLTTAAASPAIVIPETGTLREILHQVEKQVIARALKAHHGNRVKTAQALDISRRALLYKIEEYGLGREGEEEESAVE
ncbi:sigma-54-dependent transcriptional regulator [Sporolituus thermophilus]|uniref:Two-component system, NtrC family, response regulator AtoC n=1 Tax=Sporolituus thermophilus DSM 23256 TaxID=1123285 RepID=A0A1G7PM82_9FIRM|nr:sigma-54 dependent transcriptional regulator [Sporolituus thermophilus]SDF86490.1 two-component system, NtrC family, response regulator AtoC [Sporolituus thermophilus DSM 23256]